MVKFIAALILITAIASELGVIWLACHGLFPIALLGHAALSLIAIFLIFQLLPARFASNKLLLPYLCLFCIIFTLPGFGMIAMSLCLLAGLHLQRLINTKSFRVLDKPNLESPSDIIISNTIYYDLGLRGMLSTKDIYTRRSATTPAEKMSLKKAIHILKIALKDRDDEVRLSAYSFIDGKHREIETLIHELKAYIKSFDTSENSSSTLARAHEVLAGLYYEQFDLGLVDGVMKQYVLDRAEESIETATTIETSYRKLLLKARIFLSKGKLPETKSILDSLAEQNKPCSQLNWEFVKYYFNCRNFSALKQRLKLLEQNTTSGELSKISWRLWNE